MFQFLIGNVKTHTEFNKFIKKAKFQFLIGNVKTDIPAFQYAGTIPKFQFLIGNVKTYLADLLLLGIVWFQFLIGNVKTFIGCVAFLFSYQVSIPHR